MLGVTDRDNPPWGPDPLAPRDFGFDVLFCNVCGTNRYFHSHYVPFHLEMVCVVCRWVIVT